MTAIEPLESDPDVIDVNSANPRARIPDVLYDSHGRNPVSVNYEVVLSPDHSTQVYITVADDQSGLPPHEVLEDAGMSAFNGDQVFGIVDPYGNPRATLTLHPFAGEPGETVVIKVTVDDSPPAVIVIASVPDVAMSYPVQKGNARRIVHLPRASDIAS